MEIFHQGKCVKVIPNRYSVLEGLGERFKDSHWKRLNQQEKFELEVALFVRNIKNPDLRKKVEDFAPKKCIEVFESSGKVSYVLVLGSFHLKCTKRMFVISGNQQMSFR